VAALGQLEPVVVGLDLGRYARPVFGDGLSVFVVHASVTRLKNSNGKMYALKSEGSTGPRRLLAAAHRRLSSSC